MQTNRIAKVNHLKMSHDEYIYVQPTLFNGWFAFKNKAEHYGLLSHIEISVIDGINQRLVLTLQLANLKSQKPIPIDRDMALMIWDTYEIARHWPLIISYFIDSDVIPNMESIIKDIKSFCISKSIHEVIV